MWCGDMASFMICTWLCYTNHAAFQNDDELEYESDSNSKSVECESRSKFTPLDYDFILMWHIAHCISASAVDELLQALAMVFSVTETLFSSPLAIGLSAFPASYLTYKYLS